MGLYETGPFGGVNPLPGRGVTVAISLWRNERDHLRKG
jgi:hypothetical protein